VTHSVRRAVRLFKTPSEHRRRARTTVDFCNIWRVNIHGAEDFAMLALK
jgi:hypothetical protein